MKNLKVLLALLLAIPSFGAGPVGTLGTIPTMTVAGRTFTDLTNLIVLTTYATSGPHWGTFRKDHASSGYQVTAGKTLTITAVIDSVVSGTSTAGINLCYGTNDVGIDSAVAPAGITYLSGTTASTMSILPSANVGVLSTPVFFTVPANDFPCFETNGGQNTVTVFGYES